MGIGVHFANHLDPTLGQSPRKSEQVMKTKEAKARFPDYLVERDPEDCQWRIPGRYGHVYEHSPTHLGVATKKNGRIARRLAEIVRVTQEGDDGINGVFPAEKLDEVHKIVRLRRRLRHRQAGRQAMAERARENFARRDRTSEDPALDHAKKSAKRSLVGKRSELTP